MQVLTTTAATTTATTTARTAFLRSATSSTSLNSVTGRSMFISVPFCFCMHLRAIPPTCSFAHLTGG